MNYKESGVDWIGKIPEHWKLSKMKFIGKYINGYAFKPEDWSDNGLPIIRIQDLTESRENPNYFEGEIDKKYLVKDGDILISWAATLDGFLWNKGDAWLNQHIFKAIPNDEVHRHYFYWLAKVAMWNMNNDNKHGIMMQHATLGLFNNYPVPLPPFSEQRDIATVLDAKCEETDKLIATIQEEIDCLEEYKRSLIIETVTGKYSKDEETYDTGIPYIGTVPKRWGLKPLYIFFGERKNINKFLAEENLLSLSYGKIVRKDINTAGGLLPESFSTYNIVEKNDIIIRPTDLQNDKRSLRTGLCKERGIITSAYIALKPKTQLDERYYHYQLHAFDVMKVFYNMGNGVRQGLNYTEFSKLMVLEPDYKEQVEIADFLDKKCSEIDETKALKQKQLSILEEYKKSLIYEYVTGKRGVSK